MNKKLRFLAIFLSIISMIVMLASCGGGQSPACSHADDDGDGRCDSCNEKLDAPEETGATALIKGGKVNFQFVMQSGLSSTSTTQLKKLAKTVGSLAGAKDVAIQYDSEDEEIDIEILIGKVTTRGDEYIIDEHYLGPKGYAVKVIGTKILVLFGSEDAFSSAIKHLEENVFGISGSTKKLTDVSFDEAYCYEYIQDDFKLKSVTVAGNDLDDYVIVYTRNDTATKNAATNAQKALYNKTGMWLELVASSNYNGTTPAVIIETIENGGPLTTEAGARIFVDESKNLVIQCEFPERTEKVANDFLVNTIANSTKTSLSYEMGYSKAVEVRKISYTDPEFGAKGNGKTNDFEAILACHEYANQYGHTVVVNSGTYYIRETNGKRIPVMTDVDWTDAKFIIDDSFFIGEPGSNDSTDYRYHIFEIKSEYTASTYYPSTDAAAGTIQHTMASINAQGGIDKNNFTTFEHGLGYAVMIFLYNNEHKNYIRYGNNADNGTAQKELIYVAADGTVSADTPLLFNYSQVTHAIVYRVDDTPITVKGGEITTIANQMVRDYTYYTYRGISVTRSNFTLDGLVHKITGEGEEGAPYAGFLTISCTSDVTVKNCVLTAHKAYTLRTDSSNTMGTYDISPASSNNTTFYNVSQTNFFVEDGVTPSINAGYWGIMGGNDCKNLTYDTCVLTRFDSHRGTYNAKIINSTVSMISIIGGGDFTLENSTVYATTRSAIVTLRGDYGSIWHGTMNIKNVDVIINFNYSSNIYYVYSGDWYNFNHGYTVGGPTEVNLEDVRISNSKVTTISLATGIIASYSAINSNNMYAYSYTKAFNVIDAANKYSYSVPSVYTQTTFTVNGVKK